MVSGCSRLVFAAFHSVFASHEENDKPPNVVGFPQHVQTNNPYSIMLLKQCQKHKLITMKMADGYSHYEASGAVVFAFEC